jgi:aldose 1-epimerase
MVIDAAVYAQTRCGLRAYQGLQIANRRIKTPLSQSKLGVNIAGLDHLDRVYCSCLRRFLLGGCRAIEGNDMTGPAKRWINLQILVVCLVLWPIGVAAASTRTESFGETSKGEGVSRIILTNDRGMRVAVINYGATLTAVDLADRSGEVQNLILSLPDMASHERTQRRWGGIIGRYAGRIGGAQFGLGGVTHRLESGRNGVTLHGGTNGYDKRVWSFRTRSDFRSIAAIFTLNSPHGDQGFPGALHVVVTYRLMRATNELRVEYRANTTAPTFINLTNHAFFNLAGAGTGTIANHDLTILADRYAPTDSIKIPTGQLLSVAGTPLDFIRKRRIGDALDPADPMLAPSRGFDHSYIFRSLGDEGLRPIAILYDPTSGRRMRIATTEPGLQFNSGNGFDGTEVGSEGVAYPIYAGVALETQHLPDSPNQPQFPTTRLNPGQRFYSLTTYRFSVD